MNFVEWEEPWERRKGKEERKGRGRDSAFQEAGVPRLKIDVAFCKCSKSKLFKWYRVTEIFQKQKQKTVKT